MPSTKPNMIDALRAKHDPHYKLASKVSGLQDAGGKVDKLQKDTAVKLEGIHQTLSKSFGMQRKTLVRVLGLEKRLTVSDTRISNIETGIEIWTSREASRRQKEEEEKAALAQQVAEQEAAQAVLAEQAAEQAAEEAAEEAAAQAAQELEQVAEEVEQAAEKVVDVAEELGVEDEIPEGLDDVLGDIRGEDVGGADGLDGIGGADADDGTSGVGGLDGLDGASGSSGVSTKIDPSKTKPKKKKPAAKKKKPKKKRPPIKAKKRKISAKDLAKGTPFDAGYKSRVLGEDEKGEYLSKEERKRRFKLGDKQEKDGVSKTIDDVSQSSEQPASPLDGVMGIVNSIAGSIDSIRETLIGQQKVSQEQASEQREQQQQKKRGMKEKALEAGGKIMGGAKKVGEKILAPVKGLWTKVMDFLVGVLLGRTVMKLFEWFTDPANTDKVSSLFKFLKDWWPLILAGIMKFIPIILGPGGLVIGTIALLAWGIPKIINIVKSIFGFGKKVDKELKNVDDDATKTGEELGKNIENDAKKLGGDAPETEDPAKSSTPAELGDADKGQKDVKNIEEPKKMKQGGPVESKEGGQIRGEKGDDKVPAMLTDGEFVLSKGAVQAYGVDTLAGMNAAAGGTNKPTMKGGRVGYSGGGLVSTGDEREDFKILANMQQTQMKQFFGITNTVAGPIGDFESGFRMQTQEELDAENNAKLPLGLTMTRDGQNIDLGKFAGDKARMVGEMASDPKFAKALKEKGKEFGFSDMTGAQFKEIANKQGDELQREVNQYTPGTDAYDMAEIASQIDTSNPNKRSSFGNNVQNFAKGGVVQGLQGGGLVEQVKELKMQRSTLNSKRGSDGKLTGDDRKKWNQLSAEISSLQKQIIGNKNDTVPAMLTPGEFVMNKVSSAKLGFQNLMKMNANMGKGIGNLVGGAKDKLGAMLGRGDEDKVMGIAVADIPKGSPLMKSAKPPAGDAIKPPAKSSGQGGVQVDKSLTTGLGGGQGMAGAGGGKMLPLMDPAKKVSASKIAVLGITV